MIRQEKGEKFIFLIDEWDCIFRYRKGKKKEQEEFLGFSKEELSLLCQDNHKMSVEELTEWYDGYYVEGVGEMYNPKSVTEALGEGICKDYWS